MRVSYTPNALCANLSVDRFRPGTDNEQDVTMQRGLMGTNKEGEEEQTKFRSKWDGPVQCVEVDCWVCAGAWSLSGNSLTGDRRSSRLTLALRS